MQERNGRLDTEEKWERAGDDRAGWRKWKKEDLLRLQGRALGSRSDGLEKCMGNGGKKGGESVKGKKLFVLLRAAPDSSIVNVVERNVFAENKLLLKGHLWALQIKKSVKRKKGTETGTG